MFTTELKNTIDELEKIRAIKGLNKTDMAADIGIGYGTYYRWFKGEFPKSLKIIERANAYLEGYYGGKNR